MFGGALAEVWWCRGGKYAIGLCCHSVQDGMEDLGYAKGEVQEVVC